MTIFGRLDIQFPDGRSESHLLADDAITLGSAADNSIRILGAGLAERQLRIDRRTDAACLTNLASEPHLAIDGLPVPINDPQFLSDFAQIQIGELSIIIISGSDASTVAMDAVSDRTQPTARGFRAALESAVINVWPCSSATAKLSITNLTDDIAQFSVDTGGLPAHWTTPRQLIFSVNGGDTLEIMHHVAPPRRSDIPPGEYPLAITVTRMDADENAVQLIQLIQVGGFAGLSIALDPPILQPKNPFSLHLLNLGNEALALTLRPHCPDGSLDIELARNEVRLAAGERAVVGGLADRRRRPLIGRSKPISFATVAQAQAPHNFLVSQPATAIVDPIVGGRALIVAALALAVALMAIAALALKPPQPSIASFALSDAQVAQGAPVNLTWQAADAARFVIEVDRAPIAELPGEASSYSLDTSAYVDPVDIALIALNGDATDIETRRLDVFQPVTVTRFEADKTALLRNIRVDLTINWRVDGAIKVDLALPPGFETIRETITGEAGEIEIEGEPADDFQVILTAEDEIGGITTRAITIAVTEPECTPIQDSLLYEGPDTGYARVNDAVQNVPVLVKGINEDKRWLQVELASGERGWAYRSNFRCHGFDPATLKVISDIPQLPTPTPTSAPTLTSTPAPTYTPALAATATFAATTNPTTPASNADET